MRGVNIKTPKEGVILNWGALMLELRLELDGARGSGVGAKDLMSKELKALGGKKLADLFRGSTEQAEDLITRYISPTNKDVLREDVLQELTGLSEVRAIALFIQGIDADKLAADIADTAKLAAQKGRHSFLGEPLKSLENHSLMSMMSKFDGPTQKTITEETWRALRPRKVTPQQAAAIVVGVALVVAAIAFAPALLANGATFSAALSTKSAGIIGGSASIAVIAAVKMFTNKMVRALASDTTRSSHLVAQLLKAKAEETINGPNTRNRFSHLVQLVRAKSGRNDFPRPA